MGERETNLLFRGFSFCSNPIIFLGFVLRILPGKREKLERYNFRKINFRKNLIAKSIKKQIIDFKLSKASYWLYSKKRIRLNEKLTLTKKWQSECLKIHFTKKLNIVISSLGEIIL